MRIPDPKANTTTEAYLAYKAGYLEESELKPVLYEPYLHFDAWLAYWAGLVNTYPTKENGDPEMLCDEEALVAYLSGVTDTYPEEIKDPYDVRIVGYLKYLVSARWGRPEYPVNNEEFYLSTMKPPVVPSGDTPSSDIEMDDTAEAPFIDLKMYGNTSQQTYSGKNLLNLVGRTVYGVTGSVNPDNTVTISGTATITDGVVVFIYVGTLPAGTYTLSISKALPRALNFSFAPGVSARITAGNTSAKVTTQQSYTNPPIYFGVENGVTYNETFKIQFVAGSTPDYDFEPFVGGVPAPNPDYPQDVNVVTGVQNVLVHGKNMARIADFNVSNTGYTLKSISGNITATQTSGNNYFDLIAGSRAATWVPTNVETVPDYRLTPSDGGDYTLSVQNLTGSITGSQNIQVVAFTNLRRVPAATISPNMITTNQTYTLAEGEYIKAIGYWMGANNTSVNISFNVQLEKGDKTNYQPYQGATYTVDLGSIELCKIGDYQDYIYKSDDEWYIHKEVGKEVNNGARAFLFRVVTDTINSAEFIFPEMVNHNPQVYSTHFRWVNQDSANAGVHIYTYWGGSGIKYYLPNTIATTKEEWQAWLETNPDIFYYPLATYTDTKITNSELISQLEALMESGSYEGKTYIKVTAPDPNLPGLLYVEAGKYD